MLRIKIAEWLLRSAGARCEYRVKRINDATTTKRNTDGATLLRTSKLRSARRKYKALRVADTDTVAVQLVARTHQRHGTVHAGTDWIKEARKL